MSYQLSNNISTIKIANGISSTLINKKSIKSIGIVKGDTIKIGMNSCMSSIFINHKEVSSPIAATATLLSAILIDWIGDYSLPDPANE